MIEKKKDPSESGGTLKATEMRIKKQVLLIQIYKIIHIEKNFYRYKHVNQFDNKNSILLVSEQQVYSCSLLPEPTRFGTAEVPSSGAKW